MNVRVYDFIYKAVNFGRSVSVKDTDTCVAENNQRFMDCTRQDQKRVMFTEYSLNISYNASREHILNGKYLSSQTPEFSKIPNQLNDREYCQQRARESIFILESWSDIYI